MTGNQHTFRVALVVKGADRRATEAVLHERLGFWFSEKPEVVAGYGYEDGSLLHYAVSEVA